MNRKRCIECEYFIQEKTFETPPTARGLCFRYPPKKDLPGTPTVYGGRYACGEFKEKEIEKEIKCPVCNKISTEDLVDLFGRSRFGRSPDNCLFCNNGSCKIAGTDNDKICGELWLIPDCLKEDK